MKIAILAVGRLKAGPERDLFERYLDRVGPVRHTDAMRGLLIFGERPLELRHRRTADERCVLDDSSDSGVDFRTDALVLLIQVDKLDQDGPLRNLAGLPA